MLSKICEPDWRRQRARRGVVGFLGRGGMLDTHAILGEVTVVAVVPAELLARLGAVLAARGGLRLAVLFGSGATGRLRPDSDLDVAVWPLSPAAELDDLSLQSELTLEAGREVDLVRIDHASTLLKWQIAKNAVSILEASPGELARFRAYAASEYADFAPTFEHHAERFRRRLIEQAEMP